MRKYCTAASLAAFALDDGRFHAGDGTEHFDTPIPWLQTPDIGGRPSSAAGYGHQPTSGKVNEFH